MRKMYPRSNSARYITSILLLVFVVVASFSAGFLVCRYLPILQKGQFSVLLEAYSVMKNNYLNELPAEQQIEYGMIHGMLSVVEDPYTIFVEPVQHELQTNQLQGKFGGIGARLERDGDGFLLLYPFQNSPAKDAGIQEGDRLVSIEGMPVTPEMPLDQVQAAIRGPVGKKVSLVVASPPEYEQRTLEVEREEIALPSVTWNLAPQDELVGIVQINLIAATTPEEVKKAILDLQSNGAKFFILDLRNNSGGLLQAGVETAELFLSNTAILMQQYRDKPVETISNKTEAEFPDLPLVVLVNHGSASAAEIIAGALQAYDRAELIGSNTYGKDTIQLVFDLSDGSSMHVTAARWWIPGLPEPIGGSGLSPDIFIADEQTLQPEILQLAIDALRGPTQ